MRKMVADGGEYGSRSKMLEKRGRQGKKERQD